MENRITEQASAYDNLQRMSVHDILTGINREDARVHEAVAKTIPVMERLVERVVERMERGGRMFYIGAGTSGRLGVTDASELPPTYGVPFDRVIGLIAGALLAREVAKRVPTVDYPLLIASAYSGFVIWHAGLSGSIPLQLAEGYKLFAGTEQEMVLTASTADTIFHPMNIIMCCVILLVMPFVNYAMHPDRDHAITIDPTLLQDEEDKTYEVKTPADKMEHSRILWIILVVAGFAYIIYYFATLEEGKNIASALNLNIVNFIFLFLGILLHGDLRRYVDAIGEAAAGASGILLQFPFYAGIMGMMTVRNDAGVCLAGVISDFFVSISTSVTFPMWTFLSAGIVNFFVPSGGGQWAVQGPIVMPAAPQLGVEPGRAAMAIAWGDQWTNMIQPFWALPALGIAKLSARDIMGYLVIVTLFVGVVACLGFLAWAAWF